MSAAGSTAVSNASDWLGSFGSARRVPAPNPLSWTRGVWWSATIVVNALIVVLAFSGHVVDYAVEASLINFCIAVAARHDRVVGAAFVVGRSFRSYRLHQLTYHLGQLHRSMAIAGTIWFAVALVSAAGSDGARRAIGGVVVLAIILAMIWTARDRTRQARHDLFERVHRYGGWTALAILIALVLNQSVSATAPDSGIVELVLQPRVLLLVALVALVIHPWLGVKRVPADTVTVTDQVVVVALPGRRSRGEFVRVSRGGGEWHCFAVATTGSEAAGRYCLVVRRAGDWTERLARDAQCGQLTHLLVRRMRGYGFMYHAQTYTRALIVATGAGIGPVLPYLIEASSVLFDCLWIGRDHSAAVGEDLVERALAGGNLTLIDTSCGRADVGALVAERARQYEAVFVVSNEHVRNEVARVCQDLDVPWYGPTFDS